MVKFNQWSDSQRETRKQVVIRGTDGPAAASLRRVGSLRTCVDMIHFYPLTPFDQWWSNVSSGQTLRKAEHEARKQVVIQGADGPAGTCVALEAS